VELRACSERLCGDATEAIVSQIERFTPGFRDRIIGSAVRSTTQMATDNLNYAGGDIMTGANDIRQLTFGPRITLSPYTVGVPGMYICSAAIPPGPGGAWHVRCQRRQTPARLPGAAVTAHGFGYV
jgi:phytoene dehydrogenase-like protein